MAHWSRRELVALSLAASSAGCAHKLEHAGALRDDPSLNDLASRKGLRFGAAVARRDLDDARLMSVIARECGLIVAENEHKWPYLHPEPARFDFSRADALVDWADANQIATRGHTLVWHHPNWIAPWVTNYDFGANPRAEAERLLTTHINSVCAQYGDRIRSWDVVNETIDETTGQMRETVFTRAMGPEVVAFCFHAARAAAPNAQLVYNDYMSWKPDSAAHRAGVLRLLEQCRAADVPVDALGIQGHIGTKFADVPGGFEPPQEREWRAFLDAVTAMGYDLLITELDVHDNSLPGEIAPRDQAVADQARAFLDLLLSYRQTKDVLTWGIVDHRSWLQPLRPRADGLSKRPLPYDEYYQPKPMREAIAAAFRAAPPR